MKTLMTATALTLSMGFAAGPALADSMGQSVPEERRNYEREVEREVGMYEEYMETMDVDPAIRSSWVKVNQDWNSVTDEPVGSPKYNDMKDDFEEGWAEFKDEFEEGKTKGWASRSPVPEERRTFEQTTSYDIARQDHILVVKEAPENVVEKLAEVRSDWFAMYSADTYAEWNDAREAYLESWDEYVDAAQDAGVMG